MSDPGFPAKAMLFVHMPKTAGTSLRLGAVELFGEKEVALDYGRNQPETSTFVRRLKYEERDAEKFRAYFDQRCMRFLCGHFKLSDYVAVFDLDSVATFLRDPVQRVLSEYHHFVRNYKYGKSLEEFIATPRFQNQQAKRLAGVSLESLGFVGLTERYTESLERLNNHFGLAIRERRENIGRVSLLDKHRVEDSILERIKEFNAADINLYRRACELFDLPSVRTEGGAVPMGACNISASGCVVGWSCLIGSEASVCIRIELNGTRNFFVRADLFRKFIKTKGYKRSGCAGFQLTIPDISPGDTVRCYETRTNTEISNGPLVFSPGL